MSNNFKISIDAPEVAVAYELTTETISSVMADKLSKIQGLSDIQDVIITPTLSKDEIGVSNVTVHLTFDVRRAGGDIQVKNSKNYKGKRLSVAEVQGMSVAGSGIFDTSIEFEAAIAGLCEVNRKGNPIINLEANDEENPKLAIIKIDANKFFRLVMDIEENDNFDYGITNVVPIGNTYKMEIEKRRMATRRSGKKRYGNEGDRIARRLFNEQNHGGGRRRYN